MNILNRLPTFGRGSYEPKFAVEIADLERLAELATSGGEAEHTLARMAMHSPIAEIEVVMKLSQSNPYNGGYELKASIIPEANATLKADYRILSGFSVKNATGKPFPSYDLSSPQLRKAAPIQVREHWPENRRGFVLYHSVTTRESVLIYSSRKESITLGGIEPFAHTPVRSQPKQEVAGALAAYATALEQVVNGIYAKAGKPSPDATIRLDF